MVTQMVLSNLSGLQIKTKNMNAGKVFVAGVAIMEDGRGKEVMMIKNIYHINPQFVNTLSQKSSNYKYFNNWKY